MMIIKVKYLTDDLIPLDFIGGEKSDWVDLRCAEEVEITKGNFYLLPLGVAMELPEGYEAHVVPRSSTFKHWGIIQTNSMGVIDNSYKGDNDQWFMPIIATKSTIIFKNDRVCQFRIVEKMPIIKLVEVKSLNNSDRGGHGSSGRL